MRWVNKKSRKKSSDDVYNDIITGLKQAVDYGKGKLKVRTRKVIKEENNGI